MSTKKKTKHIIFFPNKYSEDGSIYIHEWEVVLGGAWRDYKEGE